MLYFQLLRTIFGSIPISKQRIAYNFFLLVHTANRFLCCSGERNGAQRRAKVSFGKTMMQALELLQLEKSHVLK